MTVENLDGKVQAKVGKKEHWRRFETFQGSELHAAIVADLHSYLGQRAIDSSIAGSEILGRIEAATPQIIEQYAWEETGGLFGMTLWNVLAEDLVRWCYTKKAADPIDDVTGAYYFRVG